MHRLLAPLLAFLLAFASAGPAAAERGPRPSWFDTGSHVVSDGERFLAYLHGDATLRVWDVIGFTRRDFALPASCYPRDAAWGRILIQCSYETLILEAASGDLRDVPGTEPARFYYGMGLHWLRGTDEAAGAGAHPAVTFLNWRTGESRGGHDQSYGPPDPRDLDDPDLPKLRRMLYGRSRGYALTRKKADSGAGGTGPLQLRRRGKVVKRIPCGDYCSDPSLTGGVATWAIPGRGWWAMAIGGEPHRWNGRRITAIENLGTQIFLTKELGEMPGAGDSRIDVVRLPQADP